MTPWPTPTTAVVSCLCLGAWILTQPITMCTPTCPLTKCLYDAGCITGPGEPYWANDYCYSWVIEVDPYCCEVGWDAVCIEMYEYCSQGVTIVEDVALGLIHLYQNEATKASSTRVERLQTYTTHLDRLWPHVLLATK